MSGEDNSWVFDSLVAFLNGPIWNAPLQSFIEERSLIFEPNQTDTEEHRKIFDDFKNLVDFMLGNFMEDIGITPDQFQEACTKGKQYRIPSFDSHLFEQIWAANDFGTFVEMMTRRNVELQLQALELIERKYGVRPDSFVSEGKATARESELERDILDEAARRFVEDEASTSGAPELERKLEDALSRVEVPQSGTVGTVVEAEAPPPKKREIDGAELKKRQEYLRAQRDKLVALKKDVRQKRLTKENDSRPTENERPKSAKAATEVLDGSKTDWTPPGQLQIRKTLAERLKIEVMGKDAK